MSETESTRANAGVREPSAPRKLIKFILAHLSVGILLFIAALVFFPFRWHTSLPAAILLFGAALFLYRAWLKDSMRLVMSALLAALFGISWATIGIFLFSSGVLYCFVANTTNPFSATLNPIAGETNLFYIADPIRGSQVMQSLLKHVNPRVTFLRAEKRNDEQQVVQLPLASAIRHIIPGVSASGGIRELIVSYTGPTLAIDFEIAHDDTRKLTVSPMIVHLPLIDFVSQPNSDRKVSWESVIGGNSNSHDLALYTAETDFALEAIGEGDFPTGLENLEKAYSVAPGALERARNRVLASVAAYGVLGGNVGRTQSDSYILQALPEWRTTHSEADISSENFRTEADQWLFDAFQDFGERHHLNGQLKKLFNIHADLPTITVTAKVGEVQRWLKYQLLDQESADLYSSEVNSLATVLENSKDCETLQKSLLERFGATPQDIRWEWETALRVRRPWGPTFLLSGIVFPEGLIDELSCINHLIQDPEKAKNTRYLQGLEKYASMLAEPNPGSSWVDMLADLSGELGYVELEKLMGRLKQLIGKKQADLEDIPAAHMPWWQKSYVDHFAASTMRLAVMLSQYRVGECTATPCRGLLSSFQQQFERDSKGNVFAPATVLAIALAERYRMSVPSEWKGISSIFPNNPLELRGDHVQQHQSSNIRTGAALP
jgi:hypothetical protein